MLIINADDIGRNEVATDRILDCYRAGRVSAASFMVFMSDSERAAQLTPEVGIDIGLHLNFTERFSASNVPEILQQSLGRVSRFLKVSKVALIIYHPFLRKDFALLVAAQIQEFTRLFGRTPQRLDGHQHMHLASNLLFDNLLPQGTQLRRSFSFHAGEKSWLNRKYRACVDSKICLRHRLTDSFYAFDPARLDFIFDQARRLTVEMMTHPERDAEWRFLLESDFGNRLKPQKLVSFASV